MTESKLKNSNELREAIIANLGGEYLAALDCLLADNARLKELEASVLKKAEMLRGGAWDLSNETGAAGDIHLAITEFWIEFESEVEAREKAEKMMASQSRPSNAICR